MSGGHFNYDEDKINEIARSIHQLILENEHPFSEDICYNKETVAEFKKGLEYLKQAYIFAKRIDYLVCGDDDEESFHERLNDELNPFIEAKND